MALELDLLDREDRRAAIPVVLERRVVDDKLAVEPHGNLLSDHLDAERIPRTHEIVGDLKRLRRILLVVVEAAGTDVPMVVRVPNRHLRSSAEVES